MSTLTFTKDFANKKVTITKSYKASLDVIWDAFTNPETAVKWWAPKPYQAVSKSINFSKGGSWLYYMLSPEGEKHFALVEFLEIVPKHFYKIIDAFCDEDGKINTFFPRTIWENSFTELNGVTTVINVMSFDKEEDITQLIEMGFEQGYEMALNQLKELVEVM